MKKAKRILAIIGIILLVLLYLSTLLFAILGKEFMNWFMAAIATTIILPIFIWALGYVYNLVNHPEEENESEDTQK